jgi:hypothetical protein
MSSVRRIMNAYLEGHRVISVLVHAQDRREQANRLHRFKRRKPAMTFVARWDDGVQLWAAPPGLILLNWEPVGTLWPGETHAEVTDCRGSDMPARGVRPRTEYPREVIRGLPVQARLTPAFRSGRVLWGVVSTNPRLSLPLQRALRAPGRRGESCRCRCIGAR